MKKFQLSLIMLAFTTCLMSCKASSSKAQAENDAKAASKATEELIVTADSCALNEGNDLQCLIKVDYPTEPTEFAKQVRQILNHELTLQYLATVSGEEGKYTGYQGDLANGKAIIEKYTQDNFQYLKQQLKDIKGVDPRANINMSYEIRLTKKAETDSYVTYNTFAYAFLGGAHGSTTDYSYNIVKSSGKVLTETVDTTKTKDLQPLLRKGILSYLNTNNEGEAITDSTLNDYLFIEKGIIPIPAHTPYLAKDGVHFIYQQYEIGPYAMGMVSFTIPYADIKPYLTEEALHLLK